MDPCLTLQYLIETETSIYESFFETKPCIKMTRCISSVSENLRPSFGERNKRKLFGFAFTVYIFKMFMPDLEGEILIYWSSMGVLKFNL